MNRSTKMQDFRKKAWEALDRRMRIITAGLSIRELRALMRGDPPTERPNPRYRVHVTSFIAHIRPKFYLKASTKFLHTFRLGYLTTLLFIIETITGLVLMIYYDPTPAGAYESILYITGSIPFGELWRDVHRLAAELMVITTFLHLLRTYFTGSYKKDRSFTWVTGVILLAVTLFTSFFGYLLTWDQLAYWAVTVGTSITESGPLIGPALNLLVRGAPDIGAGGLLRAYLAHVILLPLILLVLLSIHYYKVAREHGISLPAVIEEEEVPPEVIKDGKRRIDFIPNLLTHEVFLACVTTLILIVASAYFYDAPLETHANPQITPLDTKAPWYFWWLQGMLKIDPAAIIENLLGMVGIQVELSLLLNSKFIMGLIVPPTLVAILLAIPYIDRNPSRLARKRPFAIAWGIGWIIILLVVSYMGLPQYGIETPAATRIIQDLAPEEGLGELRAIPYAQLIPGVYEVNLTTLKDIADSCDHLEEPDLRCPELVAVFEEFSERVNEAIDAGVLPNGVAVIVIEQMQNGLMKVTPRIEWTDPDTGESKEYERHIYLHEDRGRNE